MTTPSIVMKKRNVINFSIRPFNRKYQNAVNNLINEGLGEHWGTIDPSKNQDLDDIEASYKDGDFFVALLDNEVVGTGAIIHSSKQVAEIVRMSVSPKYRRMGIGHSILDQLVTTAITKGYKKVILETTASWTDVIRFYEVYGFKFTHEINGDRYFELIINY